MANSFCVANEQDDSPVCRTCLSSTNCGYDIFAVMCSNEVTLAVTIMEFAPVQITPDDGISTFICNACVCRLENFVRFRSTCVQSTETLRRQLETETTAQPAENHTENDTETVDAEDDNNGEIINISSLDFNRIKIVDFKTNADENRTEINLQDMRLDTVSIDPSRFDDAGQRNIENGTIVRVKTEERLDHEYIVDDGADIADGIVEICNEIEIVDDDGYIAEGFIVEYEVADEPPAYEVADEPPPYEIVAPDDEPPRTTADHVVAPKRSKRRKHQCVDCGRIYAVQAQLDKHRSIYHSADRPYVCDVCGIRFTKKINLNKHMPLHSQVKPYACEICGLDFAQRGALRKHLKYSTHTRLHVKKKGGGGIGGGGDERAFDCDVCKKTFSDKWTLMKHAIVHSDERPFACDECDKCFNRPDTLRKHVATQHSDEKPFRCDACGKRFALKLLLQSHARTHSSEKPFECPQCKMRFTSRSSMAEHLKGHASDKAHKCQLCGRRFSRKSYVARHMKIKHTDIRPHECPVCGKAFKSKSNWRDHVAIHDEVPAKCCEVCGKTFATQKQLHLHTRAVHSTVRPFKCVACGVAFPTRPDLERHSVVHSNSRPFVCATCERGFKRLKDLRKHALIHDESRVHVCDVCGVKFKLAATLDKHVAAHKDGTLVRRPARTAQARPAPKSDVK